MSIAILVGGCSSQGNYEHRYLVQRFLDQFPDDIVRIISTEPIRRPFGERLKRTAKRGNYIERIRRALYQRKHPHDPELLGDLLFPAGKPPEMPGADLCQIVPGHNSTECEALLQELAPDVIVVYGTVLIKEHIFSKAKKVTLNMHTGLSPWYRGDSTLFWPIYYDDRQQLGVTVHKLVKAVDGGGIVYTGKVRYESGDSEISLFAKGVRTGTALYLKAVEDALADRIEFHRQDLSLGREFKWIHRTVAAEHRVKQVLEAWASPEMTAS